MVLKFEEFINEGVQSKVTLGYALKVLKPLGWKYERSKSGDGCKFKKDDCTVYTHLKHTASADINRTIDMDALDQIRSHMVKEFERTGDLTAIKSIDWDYWGHTNPLKRELKNINPETGKPFENEPEENIGHRLQKARMEKDRQRANERYRNARMMKIDTGDKNSGYVMMWINEFGKRMYNTCRSEDDRRPLLKKWTSEMNYETRNGRHYFGRDDMRSFKTKFYEVLSDGSLDKEMKFFKENKNIDKNLEML